MKYELILDVEGNPAGYRFDENGSLTEEQAIAIVSPPTDVPPAYIKERAFAYPNVREQLDLLYHGGFDAWRAEIKAVKDRFPKPE